MILKLISPKEVHTAGQIASRIQIYFVKLVESTEIIFTDRFDSVLEAKVVKEKIKQIAKPNWKRDIIINLIPGQVNYEEIELEVHAYPLDFYTRGTLPALAKIRGLPKGGHIILGNFIQEELKEDVDYLAKLGIEQSHKMLGVLPHNKNCFTFFSKSGIMLEEDTRKDFCPQCKEFMTELSGPLNYREIANLKTGIYLNVRKRYWEFVRRKNELRL